MVVPTAAGWPRAGLALDTILPQLRQHGGQLVVADVSNAPPPVELDGADDVAWLKTPGTWIIRARRAAYDRAEGEIVALTEDHCTVAADWITRILAAHRNNPNAAAIAGAIENGTQEHLADWALYLSAHVRLAPPLPAQPSLVGKTNVSYKRELLAAMPRRGPGMVEDLFNQWLRREGWAIVADDRIRVAHHQCSPSSALAVLQFHNGRMIAALRSAEMRPADYLRALLPGPLAAFRLARTVRAAAGKPLPRGKVVASLPLVGLMQLSHAVGETIGYLRGPGDSPGHLH